MKNRIIVCGYPKSGNTWLTQLTAEIVGCPARGFWCQPLNKDGVVEGLDRESDFECFKAHHTFEQMAHTLGIYGNGSEKLIYILRDPRSVIVSASYYFDFGPKHQRLHNLLVRFPGGDHLSRKWLYPRKFKLDFMTRGLIEGIPNRGWLKTPWQDHVLGYQKKDDILVVQYETLLTDPLTVTRKMADFLSVERTDAALKRAVEKQSFAEKKKILQAERGPEEARFLRSGRVDDWRTELSVENLELVEGRIGDFMRSLGYEPSRALCD
ncbi:MAG: sulfotransferase domain-containing protein [Verrucomicrobiota bacterium]